MANKQGLLAEYDFSGGIVYQWVSIVGERDGQPLFDLGEGEILTSSEIDEVTFVNAVESFDPAEDDLECLKSNLEETLRLRAALQFNSVDPKVKLVERSELPVYTLNI